MKMIAWLMLALTSAAPGFAEALAQGDRDRALSELYVSRKQFLDSVAHLTDAQWNFKPAPQVWSIAECAEHIAVTEDMLLERLPQLVQSPAEPQKRALAKGKDEQVLKMSADRSKKFQAPEMLVPKHRWTTQAQVVDHFRQSRDRTLDYVRTTQDDLRDHFFEHPVFKTIDAYQFILAISAHSTRHTMQLNEVKQNPGYPK
jgi:uncharacterized damage-inducible protein DinB